MAGGSCTSLARQLSSVSQRGHQAEMLLNRPPSWPFFLGLGQEATDSCLKHVAGPFPFAVGHPPNGIGSSFRTTLCNRQSALCLSLRRYARVLDHCKKPYRTNLLKEGSTEEWSDSTADHAAVNPQPVFPFSSATALAEHAPLGPAQQPDAQSASERHWPVMNCEPFPLPTFSEPAAS